MRVSLIGGNHLQEYYHEVSHELTHAPTENENPMAHKPDDVMLSKSEASAFRAKEKADSSASPQNDVQGQCSSYIRFSKSREEDEVELLGCYLRLLRGP
jgi:hypothetical protein